MWRYSIALVLGMATAGASISSSHAACEFAPVKRQIDDIIDRDAARGAKFRSEVKSGSDPIAMIEALVTPEMKVQVDICRYQTGEYLTKRGFPPFH